MSVRLRSAFLMAPEVPAAAASTRFLIVIAGAGLATLKQRRDTLYQAHGGERLHARPYYVVGDPPASAPYRCWDWFRKTLVCAFQSQENTHTQFKELAGILYQGPTATDIHLRRWRDRFGLQRAATGWDKQSLWLPEPQRLPMQDGFAHGETPYLDAIELMDRVLPLRCYGDTEQTIPPPGEAV